MGGYMLIINLAYLSALLAYKMDVIVAAYFISSRILSENVLSQYSCLLKQFDSVINSGPADMVAVALNGMMQGIYLEMGIHLKCFPQNCKPLRGLPEFFFIEKLREAALDGFCVVLGSHIANLIIHSETTKNQSILFIRFTME